MIHLARFLLRLRRQKDDLKEELFGKSEPMDPFEYGLNDELMLPFRKRKGTDIYETGLPIKVNADAEPEIPGP